MKIIRGIWNFITTIMVAAILLLAVALAGVRLFGLQPYVVLSGSMEPTFRTGGLVYVRQVDPQQLQVGDIITFSIDNDVVATHRIIAIEGSGSSLAFRTKGDANDVEDARAVRPSQIVGQALFSIPQLGLLAETIHTPEGRRGAILIGVAVILLVSVPERIFAAIENKGQPASDGPNAGEADDKSQTMSSGQAEAGNIEQSGKEDNA